MPCEQKFASFPNTRERPRKPTQDADTYQVVALDPAVSGPLDGTDEDAITESNIGDQTENGNTVVAPSDPDRTYLTLRNLDPTEAIAYGYTDLSNLDVEGMVLRAGDSVDLDAIATPIFVRPVNTGVTVDCRVDRGQG